MLKVTRETERYRHIVLYETNTTRIKLVEDKLVEDKKDRAYDKFALQSSEMNIVNQKAFQFSDMRMNC